MRVSANSPITSQKWTTKCSNLQIGNVVLVCNKTMSRGQWSMGRVIDTFPDKNNVVRQALIKTATFELRCPISKQCHIMTPSHDDDAKIN